jgi:endonuclease V-like protein UPF0215 family
MKSNIRTIGIDDGFFKKEDKTALLVGAVVRGGNLLEGVLSTKIKVDGDDATGAIARMILKSRFSSQIRAILMQGSTFAGFNIVDMQELYELTKIPVIAVTRERISPKEVKKSVLKLENPKEKMKRLGEIEQKEHKGIYYVSVGNIEASQILDITSKNSLIPEPVRIAHIIASGVSHGESVKRV